MSLSRVPLHQRRISECAKRDCYPISEHASSYQTSVHSIYNEDTLSAGACQVCTTRERHNLFLSPLKSQIGQRFRQARCPQASRRCWSNVRGNARRRKERRIVLWLYDEDYVVVLADRDRYVLLWTAYYVSWDHTRKKLLKDHEEYQKRQTPPH
jgi:hypothetical protein